MVELTDRIFGIEKMRPREEAMHKVVNIGRKITSVAFLPLNAVQNVSDISKSIIRYGFYDTAKAMYKAMTPE